MLSDITSFIDIEHDITSGLSAHCDPACVYIYIYIYISISLSLSVYIYIYIYIYIYVLLLRTLGSRVPRPGQGSRPSSQRSTRYDYICML